MKELSARFNSQCVTLERSVKNAISYWLTMRLYREITRIRLTIDNKTAFTTITFITSLNSQRYAVYLITYVGVKNVSNFEVCTLLLILIWPGNGISDIAIRNVVVGWLEHI